MIPSDHALGKLREAIASANVAQQIAQRDYLHALILLQYSSPK
jgi:hypothetical protein